jgi:NAD-dependent dihydropyrimidine dehydrogenase PreA subunit
MVEHGMITATQKHISKITKMIAPFHRVLILGCGSCTSVCFSGGRREVTTLASILATIGQKEEKQQLFIENVVERQCDWEFLEQIIDQTEYIDAILSLACGIGVQALAERFPSTPIIPGLDTCFMGMNEGLGIWSERCLGCGDCILDVTAGVCPVTRCSKSLLNGPCGGSVAGKCELSPDLPCAWQLIHDRLMAKGLLNNLDNIQPIKDWSTSHAGGPRKIVREDLIIK